MSVFVQAMTPNISDPWPLWPLTSVTLDLSDPWPLWHLSPVTPDLYDTWPLWPLTSITLDLMTWLPLTWCSLFPVPGLWHPDADRRTQVRAEPGGVHFRRPAAVPWHCLPVPHHSLAVRKVWLNLRDTRGLSSMIKSKSRTQHKNLFFRTNIPEKTLFASDLKSWNWQFLPGCLSPW